MGFTVLVRDATLTTIGQLSDYTSLTVVPRYTAVGAFTLTVAENSPQASLLVEGNGVQVFKGSTQVLSGPIRSVDWSRTASSGGKGTLTVSGVDDMTVLAEATCWPNPAAAIGSQGSTLYKISAVAAETAMRALVNSNIGPGALSARKIAGLTLDTDLARGAAVTKQVNQFDNLLTVLQDIAKPARLGFRVVQIGAGLQFQVYQPADRSLTARFSFDLGNLTDASYTTTPPTMTRALVVAGGASSPRVCKLYDRTDTLFPALVVEGFVDKTDVDTASVDLTAQMDQAADEALTSGASQGSLSMTPIDIPGLAFGVDYSVGDIVSCQVRNTFFADVVREVTINADSGSGTTVKATLGSSDSSDTSDVVAQIFKFLVQVKRTAARLATRRQA
ncbi:siphovirus ReqiPepy6 Gp37-like family protein [Streptomyces sp. V4-01]|uniref:Siphovirus ReqiPepy6 Gp37-like family protein n=1 Tax=Actinacidiphila polyblastidii TaxID=3110430 RepID=A0ABU7P7E3_9ACTN|nr:siphovirus ReqiPepy6 Gp37-like family protein [Streptomyces sp. V4-01]